MNFYEIDMQFINVGLHTIYYRYLISLAIGDPPYAIINICSPSQGNKASSGDKKPNDQSNGKQQHTT